MTDDRQEFSYIQTYARPRAHSHAPGAVIRERQEHHFTAHDENAALAEARRFLAEPERIGGREYARDHIELREATVRSRVIPLGQAA